MKKLITLIALGLMLSGLWSTVALADGNASMSFDPSSGNIPTNADWSVKVIVNTDNQNSTGADVVVNFEKDKLELKSVVFDKTNPAFYPNDGFMPSVSESNTKGQIEMARIIAPGSASSLVYTKGSGTFAILTFRAKVTSGTTTLTFAHTLGNTTDSNITPENTSMGLDILKTVTNGTYTISGTAPQPVPQPLPQPAPQPLPKNGPEAFIWAAIFGSSALAAGVSYRKLTPKSQATDPYTLLSNIQPEEYIAPEDRHNLI